MFQFREIFKRNLQYLLRNPRTLQALFVNVIVTSFVIEAVFWHVAEPDYFTPSMTLNTELSQLLQNLKGLSFLLVNSLMFPAITLVVI
jgi:hypothetical protein